MTSIKSTYTLTFTATSPFNEATYPDQTLEEVVEVEKAIDFDDVIDIIRSGSYRDEDLKVEVEVID